VKNAPSGKRAVGTIPAPRPPRTILDHLRDPESLGGLAMFRNRATWFRWDVFLKAVYGLEMGAEEREIFTHHTARTTPNPGGYSEVVALVGRRGGKDAIATAIANYEGANAPPSEQERYVFLVAQDERNALRTLLSYTRAPYQRIAAWRAIVKPKGLTKDSVRLVNNVTLATYPGNRPEALRGPTALCVLLDELAFMLSTEGRPVDREMLRAARPALATTEGKLVILSSPYSQVGALYDLFAKFWGAEGTSTLIWKGESREMNPTLSADYLARMEADDPESYRSEILAEFRAGLSALFDPLAIDRVTDHGTRERPPLPGVTYFPFFDGSSGRNDAAGLTIWCMGADGRAIECLARRWPAPHSPADVRSEVAAILRAYHSPVLWGDLYAIGLVEDGFNGYGISYQRSHADASTLCLNALALVNSGRCVLLDLPEQRRELIGLERRRGTGGRDRVGHSRVPDDLAVACCGGMVLAAEMNPTNAPSYEVTAHERAEMAGVAEWLGGGRDGEVVDIEAGYEHDSMAPYRTTRIDGPCTLLY